jgi:hypothetical protein
MVSGNAGQPLQASLPSLPLIFGISTCRTGTAETEVALLYGSGCYSPIFSAA